MFKLRPSYMRFLILTLLTNLASAYPNIQNYLQGTQTGLVLKSTATPTPNTAVTGGSWKYFQYTITYITKFYHTPQLVVGMVSLQNCPVDDQQYVKTYYKPISADLTKFIFQSQMAYFIYYAKTQFLNRYMLIDVFKNNNIEVKKLSVLQTVFTTQTFTITFGKSGVNLTTTKVVFLMDGIYCQKIVVANMYYKIIVLPLTLTTLNVTFSTNNVPAAGCNDKVGHHFTIVILYPHADIVIESGILTATPSAQSEVSISLSNPLSSYLIGVYDIELPDSCFDYGLVANLTLVNNTNSKYNILKYSYFQLTEVQVHILSEVISEPLKARIQFTYSTNIEFVTLIIQPVNIFALVNESPSTFSATYNQQIKYHTIEIVAIAAAGRQTKIKTRFNLITMSLIRVNPHQNSLDVTIWNTYPWTVTEYLLVNDTRVQKGDLVVVDDVHSILKLSYDSGLLGEFFELQYLDTTRTIDSKTVLTFLTIFDVSTSPLSPTRQSQLFIKYIPDSDIFSHLKLSWNSAQSDNVACQRIDGNGVIDCQFDYVLGAELEDTFVEYRHNPNTDLEIHLVYKLLILKEIRTEYDSDSIKFTFYNTFNINSLNESNFKTNQSSITFDSLETQGDFIILAGRFPDYLTTGDTSVTITYFDSQTIFTSSTHIRFSKYFKLVFHQDDDQLLTIVLKNNHQFNSSNLPNFDFSSSEIDVENVSITAEEVLITCRLYQSTSSAGNLDVELRTISSNSKVYNEVVEISVPQQNCLLLRGSQSYQLIVTLSCYILDALYVGVFVLAVVSCQKLYGVEMLYLIQLTYYLLIQLDIRNCSSLEKLSELRYSTGVVSLDIQEDLVRVPRAYRILDIRASFIENVNVSIVPILICPIIYFILNYVEARTKNELTKYRCQKYKKSFLCEVPLTLLLFNSFNICTSAVISFQLNGLNNIPSLIASLVLLLLLPVDLGLFITFRNNFIEFKKEFDEIDNRCCINSRVAGTLRRTYVIVLILEFVSVPVVLSLSLVKQHSLYIVFIIEAVITLYVIVLPLYFNRWDNVRNYVHRLIALSVVGIQIAFWKVETSTETKQTSLYHMIPFFILGVLVLGFACTGTYIIVKSVKFWKHVSPLERKLKLKEQGKLNKKPIDKNPPSRQSHLWVPLNWYVQKSTIMSSKSTKPMKSKQLSPSEKMLCWFEEMQEDRVLRKLGVDKDFYEMFRMRNPSWFEKEKLIRETFEGVDLDYILESLSLTIGTIDECLVHIGESKCRHIKDFNLRKYSRMFPNEEI